MDREVIDSSREAYESIPDYVNELKEHFRASASLLKIGKDHDGLCMFSEGIDTFADLMVLVKQLGEIGAVTIDDKFIQSQKQIAEFTGQLEEARENGDMVLFADILEFEAGPAMESLFELKWNDSFGK